MINALRVAAGKLDEARNLAVGRASLAPPRPEERGTSRSARQQPEEPRGRGSGTEHFRIHTRSPRGGRARSAEAAREYPEGRRSRARSTERVDRREKHLAAAKVHLAAARAATEAAAKAKQNRDGAEVGSAQEEERRGRREQKGQEGAGGGARERAEREHEERLRREVEDARERATRAAEAVQEAREALRRREEEERAHAAPAPKAPATKVQPLSAEWFRTGEEGKKSPEWLREGFPARWWSKSQKKYLEVKVSRLDVEGGKVVVTFDADPDAFKRVRFSSSGKGTWTAGDGLLQPWWTPDHAPPEAVLELLEKATEEEKEKEKATEKEKGKATEKEKEKEKAKERKKAKEATEETRKRRGGADG